MKKVVSILLPLVLTAGIFNCAEAQRSNNRGFQDRGRSNSNVSQQRNERGNFSERNYRSNVPEIRNVHNDNGNNFNRTVIVRREDGRANAINNNNRISTNQQRNEVAVLEDRGRHNGSGVAQQRVYRENDVSRRYVNQNDYNRYNGYNRYNNHYNNSYYGGGYYSHFFMYGPRYSILPRSFITINFGGYPYYYNDGLFYGSYGGYYQPLFPPPGICIGALPFGYSRIFIGDDPFYYYNGIYYRQLHDENNYEVVDAPMGATVSFLPKGAKSVMLNGEKLYELNGTYYKEDRNYKGETVYTVVGKNGEVNNSNGAADTNVPPAS